MFVDEDMPQEEIAKKEMKTTKLQAFFELNKKDIEARQYLYEEIPTHYVFVKGEWKRRKIYCKTISRTSIVNLSKREAFCLRLLLKDCRGPQSYQDVRTI